MRPEFQVHLLNGDGIRKARAVGELFSAFLADLEYLVPPGRARALVITKLQEAAFFAKRGVAEMAENQVELGDSIMNVAENQGAGE